MIGFITKLIIEQNNLAATSLTWTRGLLMLISSTGAYPEWRHIWSSDGGEDDSVVLLVLWRRWTRNQRFGYIYTTSIFISPETLVSTCKSAQGHNPEEQHHYLKLG
jgi:hypothetical protein